MWVIEGKNYRNFEYDIQWGLQGYCIR